MSWCIIVLTAMESRIQNFSKMRTTSDVTCKKWMKLAAKFGLACFDSILEQQKKEKKEKKCYNFATLHITEAVLT